MSEVPLAATAPGQTLQMVDLTKALDLIRTQVETGWNGWMPIQIDLDDIHRELKEAGVPLPEDSSTINKVQSFVVATCTLLGWNALFRSNNEDWWVEIIT